MPEKLKLIWEPSALEDLNRLREFLATKRPKAAKNAAHCIIQAANRLLDFPNLGHPINELPEFNALSIPFGRYGYIMRYRIDGENIVILRVWHAREEREH